MASDDTKKHIHGHHESYALLFLLAQFSWDAECGLKTVGLGKQKQQGVTFMVTMNVLLGII